MNFCRLYNRLFMKAHGYLKTKTDKELVIYTPIKEIDVIDGCINLIFLYLIVLGVVFISLVQLCFDALERVYSKMFISRCDRLPENELNKGELK